MSLSRHESLLYAGGLFDGEGSAGVYSIHRPRINSPYTTFVPTMQIRMCDPEPVWFFKHLFDGGWYGVTRPSQTSKNGTKKRIIYEWRISHKKALQVAIELHPYLTNEHKRQQVGSLLDHYEIPHSPSIFSISPIKAGNLSEKEIQDYINQYELENELDPD